MCDNCLGTRECIVYVVSSFLSVWQLFSKKEKVLAIWWTVSCLWDNCLGTIEIYCLYDELLKGSPEALVHVYVVNSEGLVNVVNSLISGSNKRFGMAWRYCRYDNYFVDIVCSCRCMHSFLSDDGNYLNVEMFAICV